MMPNRTPSINDIILHNYNFLLVLLLSTICYRQDHVTSFVLTRRAHLHKT